MSIPDFVERVIPPFVEGASDRWSPRSPYQTSMAHVVERLGSSARRKAILHGLVEYRAALRAAGLGPDTELWLAGSFVEDLDREPGDVDVVVILDGSDPDLPPLDVLEPLLSPRSKAFDVDAYLLDRGDATSVIDWTCYWFGLFGHRRSDSRWKGILVVPLGSDADDESVLATLDADAADDTGELP